MIPPRTLVRDKKSGTLGIICQNVSPNGKTPLVVFEGTATPTECTEDALTVLGTTNPVADEARCGAGRGAECCVFLSFDAASRYWLCQRFGEHHWTHVNASVLGHGSTAQRVPLAFYPDCQLQPSNPVPAV